MSGPGFRGPGIEVAIETAVVAAVITLLLMALLGFFIWWAVGQ